jgi:hypothetical protein
LAGPSFHDGSESVWACAWAQASRNKNGASIIRFIVVHSIEILLAWVSSQEQTEGTESFLTLLCYLRFLL